MNTPSSVSLSVPPAPTAPAPERDASEQRRWFKDEVHVHEAQLKAYLRGKYPSVRDVEDVVQDSYVRIWKARLIRPIHSTKSFLFQIVSHLAVDTVRKRKIRFEDSAVDLDALAVLDNKPSPVAALSQKEKTDLLCDALASVPDRTREILFLRKFQSVPQKTVAAQFGISERTVEDQVSRGMKRCEAYLHKHGVEGFATDER